jgi:hypothetical protein
LYVPEGSPGNYGSGIIKLNPDGSVLWMAQDVSSVAGGRQVTGVALDAAGNPLMTCVTTNAATGNDWATVRFDTNGNELWVKTYNGSVGGDGSPIAIAIAPDGSIYVTGYSANTSGGIDITTIKYFQSPTIQPQPGGAMLLQLPGAPGQSCGLGATTDLLNWLELGPVVAGTNGLFQFTDTNAPLYPSRFYHWHSP